MGRKGSRVTQGDLAERCGVDQATVSRILKPDLRGLFADQTAREVLKVARELGYLDPELAATERRRCPRAPVLIRAHVRLILADGIPYDEGACGIADISVSGMHLVHFRTRKMALPLEHFTVGLTFDLGRLEKVTLGCNVTRFDVDGKEGLGVGVRYEYFSKDPEEMVQAVLKGKTAART